MIKSIRTYINSIEFIISFIISLLFFIIATWISVYFRKNPINTDIKKSSFFRDKEWHIKYVVWNNHKGRIVKRINRDALDLDWQEINSFASEWKNQNQKGKPKSYEECEWLIYK